MVDWLVRNNMKLWTPHSPRSRHTERLRQKGALATRQHGVQLQREDLFARLPPRWRTARQFDAEREAQDIVAAVKESLAQTFGVNVLAVGLARCSWRLHDSGARSFGSRHRHPLAIAGWLILRRAGGS